MNIRRPFAILLSPSSDCSCNLRNVCDGYTHQHRLAVRSDKPHTTRPPTQHHFVKLMDINAALTINGFAMLHGRLPETSGVSAFAGLGEVIRLPGVAEVQMLTPQHTDYAPPNTYSGNFGLQAFPLHTDLAHWFLPPRYFALRCINGSKYVSTNLVDVEDLISIVGRQNLMRALVRPRRPLKQNRPLLRLLSNHENTSALFRWDSLFVTPATNESQVICETTVDALASIERIEVLLANPGDTLIIDNWRMLHGRSRVSIKDNPRRIERAYLGAIY